MSETEKNAKTAAKVVGTVLVALPTTTLPLQRTQLSYASRGAISASVNILAALLCLKKFPSVSAGLFVTAAVSGGYNALAEVNVRRWTSKTQATARAPLSGLVTTPAVPAGHEPNRLPAPRQIPTGGQHRAPVSSIPGGRRPF